jgi:hypothetical protein
MYDMADRVVFLGPICVSWRFLALNLAERRPRRRVAGSPNVGVMEDRS